MKKDERYCANVAEAALPVRRQLIDAEVYEYVEIMP